MNFSMFIPQVDEVDLYDANGTRINDINSVTEYISDVLLHHKGKPRKDEDDDNARYFHCGKTVNYCFTPQVSVITPDHRAGNDGITFPNISASKPLSVYYEVVTPPPKASA